MRAAHKGHSTFQSTMYAAGKRLGCTWTRMYACLLTGTSSDARLGWLCSGCTRMLGLFPTTLHKCQPGAGLQGLKQKRVSQHVSVTHPGAYNCHGRSPGFGGMQCLLGVRRMHAVRPWRQDRTPVHCPKADELMGKVLRQ